MRRNPRQEAINRLRQNNSKSMFDDRFDRHFDRFDKTFDNAFERPARTFLKLGLVAIVLNLILWGLLIAGIFFGLNYFGVI